MTHPAIGPQEINKGSESLSRREKLGLELEGELRPLHRGRMTKPSGQEGFANGGPSKLRGPTRAEDTSQTVTIMVTAANAN